MTAKERPNCVIHSQQRFTINIRSKNDEKIGDFGLGFVLFLFLFSFTARPLDLFNGHR